MSIPKTILSEVLSFTPENKAILVNELLNSLDQPDDAVDFLWAEESEGRINAYEQGKIKAVSINDILKKYNR